MVDMAEYPATYLEGHGDLVSRLIIRIARITRWVIGVISYQPTC